jgi:hypothetical protein
LPHQLQVGGDTRRLVELEADDPEDAIKKINLLALTT